MARNFRVMDINSGKKRTFASLANAVTFATEQANQSWTDRTWTVRMVNRNGQPVLNILADCAYNFTMVDIATGQTVGTLADNQGYVGRDGKLHMTAVQREALIHASTLAVA